MTKLKTPVQPTNALDRSLRQLRRTRQSKHDSRCSALVRRNHTLCNGLHLSQLQHKTSKVLIGNLQQQLVEQKKSNQEMRVQLRRLQHDIDNAASGAARATTAVAMSMIAMSEQVCRTCLGSRTIMKIKKNQRYSVECKACKE
jgi:uncharacterized coiled-coil protein SlyX